MTKKLLTAVAGGNPPPLYYADRFTVPQFAYQGFFTNITEFADAGGVMPDQYYDFAWQEVVYKDGIYALPFDTGHAVKPGYITSAQRLQKARQSILNKGRFPYDRYTSAGMSWHIVL